MTILSIDPETGEILPSTIMVSTNKAPAIIIDISDVDTYHSEPEKLVDKIRAQTCYAVFNIASDKGRKDCNSNYNQIIKCIAPACNASKAKAAEAKKIIAQDLYFRKTFEAGVREIAEFNRSPLTDYENELQRVKDEFEAIKQKRLADEKYLIDWDDALNLNELFTLRKEKEIADKKRADKEKAIEGKRLFDEAVINQAEALRLQIQVEEEAKAQAKAEAEQDEKERIERDRVAAEPVVEIDREVRQIIDDAQLRADQGRAKPTRSDLINAVVLEFGVDVEIAGKWLIEEFSTSEEVGHEQR